MIQESEKEYGAAAQQVADNSMKQVRVHENSLSKMNATLMFTRPKDLKPDPIARAADGSYQQRGFSSDNGIVDMVSCSVRGPSGGLAVADARILLRKGSCPTCERAAAANREPKPHACCIDFHGSARSMEPAGIVDMEHQHRLEGNWLRVSIHRRG